MAIGERFLSLKVYPSRKQLTASHCELLFSTWASQGQ